MDAESAVYYTKDINDNPGYLPNKVMSLAVGQEEGSNKLHFICTYSWFFLDSYGSNDGYGYKGSFAAEIMNDYYTWWLWAANDYPIDAADPENPTEEEEDASYAEFCAQWPTLAFNLVDDDIFLLDDHSYINPFTQGNLYSEFWHASYEGYLVQYASTGSVLEDDYAALLLALEEAGFALYVDPESGEASEWEYVKENEKGSFVFGAYYNAGMFGDYPGLQVFVDYVAPEADAE